MSKLVSVIVLITCILFPPFAFYSQFGWEVRVFSVVLTTLYLLMLSKIPLETIVYFSFIVLFYVTLLLLTSPRLEEDSRIIFSRSMLLVFGFLHLYYLRTSNKAEEFFLKYYEYVSNLIALAMLSSIFYYIFFGEQQIIVFDSDGPVLIQTPFGFLFIKYFGDAEILRASFFFAEPSFAGLYFALNIAAMIRNTGSFAKQTVWLNITGGVLTFSFTFYFVAILLLAFRLGYIWLLILCTAIISLLTLSDLTFLLSSASDRLLRASIFFDAFSDSDLLMKLFGSGIINTDLFGVSFSSGLLNILYESGVAGLVAYLFIIKIMYRQLRMVVVFIIVSATSVSPPPLLFIALTVFYFRAYKKPY